LMGCLDPGPILFLCAAFGRNQTLSSSPPARRAFFVPNGRRPACSPPPPRS